MTLKNVATNPVFLKLLTLYVPNLTVEFFFLRFSPEGHKTEADPPNSQK